MPTRRKCTTLPRYAVAGLITVADAVDEYEIGKSTIYRLRKSGELSSPHPYGSKVPAYLVRAELDEMIEREAARCARA